MGIVAKPPNERSPARMAPLSVLPVFVDLTGKPVLVAGGSGAAAWKAELLAAAGAKVRVVARRDALGEEMTQIIADADGRIAHQDRDWGADSFAGMALAVADAEDDSEAWRFAAAARGAGVPCNVIDRPAACGFQFGSIVNRSPVVVGISTSGAAPILGQAVRRRIETLLPPWLTDWAALAQRLRGRVLEALAPGRARRRFWEGFVDRAFAAPPPAGLGTEPVGWIAAAESGAGGGHVTFVGAGPGEAELLTVKAVRALQAADVILFDDLVSDTVLELARREAKRILVGKRAGRASCRQEEINDLMVRLARAGRRVVRLKSGDPTIFGRGGEEMARLRAAGIPFDIVPGITAGMALAAALGVSLTRRATATSVRLVTGHSHRGGLPEDLDWRALADPTATTLFYMGGRMAGEIAGRLLALGLPGDTPAVLAEALTRPEQRIRRCRLDGLADAAPGIDRTLPVVIGIGQVFADPIPQPVFAPIFTNVAAQ